MDAAAKYPVGRASRRGAALRPTGDLDQHLSRRRRSERPPAPEDRSTLVHNDREVWFRVRGSEFGGCDFCILYSIFCLDFLTGRVPLYSLMPEAKKGLARIQVPPKAPRSSKTGGDDASQERGPDAMEARGVHMLMSKAIPTKRDPLIVPLVGLLLAFSVISLIVQMLIAFG